MQMQSLNTYPNLYYNPIKIPTYTVVEIYKNEVAENNSLGYFIIPIKDMDNNQLESAIYSRAIGSKPADCDKYIILGGREYNTYENRITYFVWYSGDTVPQYPELPELITPPPAAKPFEKYTVVSLYNQGSGDTDVTITLTVDEDGDYDFYINDDYYSFTVTKLYKNNNKIVFTKNGVTVNDIPINTFTFSKIPTLRTGSNFIKVTKKGIKNIKCDYVPHF